MHSETTDWGTKRGDTFVLPSREDSSSTQGSSSSSSSSSSSTNITTSSSGVSVQYVPAPRPALPKGTHKYFHICHVFLKWKFSFHSQCMQEHDTVIGPFTNSLIAVTEKHYQQKEMNK